MKKLIPALCMLLIAAAMLGTSTYAWFSMNKTVTATGMQVKATSAASLVIDENQAGLLNNRKVTQSLTADPSAIAPSTLNWTNYTTTGLGYVTNPEDVDPNTGAKKAAGPELTIVDVNGDDSGVKYYIDYTIYVAASGQAMTAALEARLDSIPDSLGDLRQAFTVAFYVDSVSSGNLKGTLRFDQTAESDKVVLVTKAENSIPAATGTNGIKVIMRVYLDGAYDANSDGTYNVNNGTVNTDSVTFGAKFTANEA